MARRSSPAHASFAVVALLSYSLLLCVASPGTADVAADLAGMTPAEMLKYGDGVWKEGKNAAAMQVYQYIVDNHPDDQHNHRFRDQLMKGR